MIYLIVALFIVLDMVTGLIKAFKEKAYTSTIMREGLFHKCGSILCVVFGVLVDYTQTLVDIGVNVPVAVSNSKLSGTFSVMQYRRCWMRCKVSSKQ